MCIRDRLSAELVKKQFILKGNEIYQLLINKLTEEEKDVYKRQVKNRLAFWCEGGDSNPQG